MPVSFTNDKIIFAIHVPILDPQQFDYFHLYPIPKGNYTLIPTHPYLVLSSSQHQYDDEESQLIETTYICQIKLAQNEDDCITHIMQKTNAGRCHLVPIRLGRPLLEQISKDYILAIPNTEPVRIKKMCNGN